MPTHNEMKKNDHSKEMLKDVAHALLENNDTQSESEM